VRIRLGCGLDSRLYGILIIVQRDATQSSLFIILRVHSTFFDVLLSAHLSIFMSVFNQLDAQNLFHNKFYFMPLHTNCVHQVG